MGNRQSVAVAAVLLTSLLSLFPGPARSAEPQEPSAARQAAEKDFHQFLQASWEIKKEYGFQANDKMEEASLAKPVPVYGIDPEKAGKLKAGSSILPSIDATGSWLFPVEVKGRYRTMFLVVRQGDGAFKGVSLGDPDLAGKLQKLRRVWSVKGEDRFRYVTCFNPRSSFFIVTSVSKPNLTPLTKIELGPKEKLTPPADPASWMSASKVIPKLQKFWSEGKRLSPFGGLAEPDKT
jgi:hypothetical protein